MNLSHGRNQSGAKLTNPSQPPPRSSSPLPFNFNSNKKTHLFLALPQLSIAVKSFKIMTTFVKPDVSTPEGTPMVTGMCKTYSFHVKRLLAECAVSEEIVKLKKEKVRGLLAWSGTIAAANLIRVCRAGNVRQEEGNRGGIEDVEE